MFQVAAESSRPQTAFEQYLHQKRDGSHHDRQENRPQLPFASPKTTVVNKPATQAPKPPLLPAYNGNSPQRSPGASAHPAAKIQAPPIEVASSTPDLAKAAMSLALAAQRLAVLSPDTSKQYSNLAKAASALVQSPRGPPPPFRPETPSQSSYQAEPLAAGPSTFAPFNGGRPSGLPRGPGSQRNGSRLSTPKFPSYNPLIHLRTSELAPPGTATAVRPATSNPITHGLEDGSNRPGSSASARPASRSIGERPHSRAASQAGSQRLEIGGEGGDRTVMEGSSRPGTPMSRKLVDHMEFALKHPERVRLNQWPPRTPLAESEVARDDFAARFNRALNELKDRLSAKGPAMLARCFQQRDKNRSGIIEYSEFREAVRDMNAGHMEDDVIATMAATVDVNNDGIIDYNEFMDAVRFGKVRYMSQDGRLKHRLQPNPDEPIGGPTIKHPYGVLQDAEANLAEFDRGIDAVYGDLKSEFSRMDTDHNGLISWPEFHAALSHMSERHQLQLSDHELVRFFQEADDDFSGEIDYAEFMASFSGSNGKRFMPEFLRPKALRCSTRDHPWTWRERRVIDGQSPMTMAWPTF